MMSDEEDCIPSTPLGRSFRDSTSKFHSPPPSERSQLLNLVPRVQWSAVAPTESVAPLVTPVSNVVIHWTGGQGCTEKEDCTRQVWLLQKNHMRDQGWKDIQYNYVVGGDGFVYEGLGWTKASPMVAEVAHGLNGSSLVVGLIGTQREDSSVLIKTSLTSLFAVGTLGGYMKEDVELFGFSDGILSKPGKPQAEEGLENNL